MVRTLEMPLYHPASVQGNDLRGVWIVFGAGALFVAVFVYTLIIIAIVRWRQRADDDGSLPPQFKTNKFWEITGTVIPLIVVTGLFLFTLSREYRVDAVEPGPFENVDVTAFRWSWQFRYPGHGITVTGTANNAPVMVLPVGKLTQINLYSEDVVHAFWVPDFLFKRDATPGYTMHFDVTPSRTGTFLGKCVEFCGLDHARMTFLVRVVPLPQFRRWIASGGTAPV